MTIRQTSGLLIGMCWLATGATFVRGLRGVARMRASLGWLADGRQPNRNAAAHSAPDLHVVVLLPLLREQRLIAETVEYFRGLQQADSGLSVVLVTTQREHVDRAVATTRLATLADALATGQPAARLLRQYLGVLPQDRLLQLHAEVAGRPPATCRTAVEAVFYQLPPTDDLAAKLAVRAQAEGADVRHHHPDPHADMADQLNFAASAELERLSTKGRDPRTCYLAIYNADSRPEQATFSVLRHTAAELERVTGSRPEVVQQSALFVRNLSSFGRGAQGAYLTGAALLQSRWTLAHEIPSLRRQARAATAKPRGTPRLGHCTGHGLFIRADAYNRWQGLPTATMNEDLAFGYLRSAAGTPIYPLPVLEWADSPETAIQVIRQKHQWFWSYLEYPKAARLAAGLHLGTQRERARLVIRGLARGVIWLGASPAVAATLALPLLRCRPGPVAAATAALGTYYAVPFHLILRELRRRGQPAGRLDGATLAGGLAAYLTHSVGPWWCCVDAFRRLTGTRYDHDKTER